jgi:hypothetical protein
MPARGDRERELARRERAAADVEHERAERHDIHEHLHRQAEARHRQAAATHENAAALFDAHDDPDVPENEAIEIADRAIREAANHHSSPK